MAMNCPTCSNNANLNHRVIVKMNDREFTQVLCDQCRDDLVANANSSITKRTSYSDTVTIVNMPERMSNVR